MKERKKKRMKERKKERGERETVYVFRCVYTVTIADEE